MKLFVFMIVAGCAVKCDESSNYYVIERPSEEPVRALKPFQVYWNVPTMQCTSKKIPFESLYEQYGIIQNKDDKFQGEQLVILYDPGLFPAILKDDSSGKLKFRNGGVPQEGNLDEHLTAFRYSLEHAITDPDFNGVAIIDFESWRPVFRQNFGELTPYKNVSILNERRQHPRWPRSKIEAEAKYRFERAGREFMQATISLAKLLRPRARWGYYAFPYCFNMAGNNHLETCTDQIQSENDQIPWLWSESTALYPSIYSSKNLSAPELAALIRGRVAESARVNGGGPILPYFWFKYRDAGFMSELDLKSALKTLYKSSATGFIIWGSSNDVNTVAKCEKLKNYLEQVLGPAIAKYTKQAYKIDDDYIEPDNVNDTKIVNVTTENPFDELPSATNVHAVNVTNTTESGEINNNYTEDLSDRLADELMSSNQNNSDSNILTNENNSILIDILLHIIENMQKDGDKTVMENEMAKINKDRKKGTPIHDTFIKLGKSDFNLSTKSPLIEEKKKGDIFSSLFTAVAPEFSTITVTNDVTSTTNFNDASTTETWYDNSTFYNVDTFTDFNNTAITDQTYETFEDALYDNEVKDENETSERDEYATKFTTEENNLSTYTTESLNTTTENLFSTTNGMTTVMGAPNDSLSVASANNKVVISVV